MGFSRDDAIDYQYSIDNRRWIQRWKDFKEIIIFEAMKKVITEVVAFFIVSNVKSLHDHFIITKSYFLLDNSQ